MMCLKPEDWDEIRPLFEYLYLGKDRIIAEIQAILREALNFSASCLVLPSVSLSSTAVRQRAAFPEESGTTGTYQEHPLTIEYFRGKESYKENFRGTKYLRNQICHS